VEGLQAIEGGEFIGINRPIVGRNAHSKTFGWQPHLKIVGNGGESLYSWGSHAVKEIALMMDGDTF